jgi:hypothetical protein
MTWPSGSPSAAVAANAGGAGDVLSAAAAAAALAGMLASCFHECEASLRLTPHIRARTRAIHARCARVLSWGQPNI